jgi:type IV pilus assembly protein PilE
MPETACTRPRQSDHPLAGRGAREATVKKHSLSGFTLIEVMIVVAIIAIISAVAIPGYQEYVMRGRLQEGLTGMMAKQVQLEMWFDFSCNGTEAAGTFTLTAVGKNTLAGFQFTVDQANTRVTVAVPAGWLLPVPNNCWVSRKGGKCS